MKKTLLVVGALALSAGLIAYGVSPSQYTQSQSQAQQGQPGQLAPAPMPVPGNSMAPGAQPMMQQPQAQQNFDQMAVPDWAKEWKHYHWEDAKAMYDKKEVLFIDARAKLEYDQGHIPGAIPMPLGEFDKYYAQYEKKIKAAKNIATYCHGVGCQLSNKVAQKLWEKGYKKNMGSFFGGWPQWQQHNMPVETGPGPK